MPTRSKCASQLGVSEFVLQQYLHEFPELFAVDGDLTTTDVALLRIIHFGKMRESSSADIRAQLLEFVQVNGPSNPLERRAPKAGPGRGAAVEWIQGSTETAGGGTGRASESTGHAASALTGAGTGNRADADLPVLTRQDLIEALDPMMRVIQGLQLEVYSLRRQVASRMPQLEAGSSTLRNAMHSEPEETWWRRLRLWFAGAGRPREEQVAGPALR